MAQQGDATGRNGVGNARKTAHALAVAGWRPELDLLYNAASDAQAKAMAAWEALREFAAARRADGLTIEPSIPISQQSVDRFSDWQASRRKAAARARQ